MSQLLAALLLLISIDDPHFGRMVEVRRHLHAFPELSNREVETQKYLLRVLQDSGFDDISKLAGTGLKVVYRTDRPGPVIAFRADIDALPIQEATGLPYASKVDGTMHACGHDLHTAMLLGAMLAIKADPHMRGTFVFLFQPAEEGPPPGEVGGASLMVRDGALEDPKPDVIFGLHGMGWLPTGQVGYRVGGLLARADRFRIEVIGRSTHGSTPQNGVDPIYVAANIVTQAQSIVSRSLDPRESVVISFGQFSAGNRFNIIPGSATLEGTIRSLNEVTGNRVPELLERITAGVCQALGASYRFHNEQMCPSTINDATWTERGVSILRNEGFKLVNVEPILVAEDFAYYAQHVPGVYFFLGTCREGTCANIHEATYNPDEDAMKTGASLFYRLARSLSQQEL